jgi:hypothetical protein
VVRGTIDFHMQAMPTVQSERAYSRAIDCEDGCEDVFKAMFVVVGANPEGA